jgi:cytochrome c553
MKLTKSTIAILVLLCSAADASAGDGETVSFGKAFADTNCAWCHGPSGQGYATAPKLAGQRSQYLENQLLSFKAAIILFPNSICGPQRQTSMRRWHTI